MSVWPLTSDLPLPHVCVWELSVCSGRLCLYVSVPQLWQGLVCGVYLHLQVFFWPSFDLLTLFTRSWRYRDVMQRAEPLFCWPDSKVLNSSSSSHVASLRTHQSPVRLDPYLFLIRDLIWKPGLTLDFGLEGLDQRLKSSSLGTCQYRTLPLDLLVFIWDQQVLLTCDMLCGRLGLDPCFDL